MIMLVYSPKLEVVFNFSMAFSTVRSIALVRRQMPLEIIDVRSAVSTSAIMVSEGFSRHRTRQASTLPGEKYTALGGHSQMPAVRFFPQGVVSSVKHCFWQEFP